MFWYFITSMCIIAIYLSYLIWWEYWGQFAFNRIIIKKDKIKEDCYEMLRQRNDKRRG